MIDDMRLDALAKEYLIAKERFDRAVRINIRTAEVMQDKSLFWEVINELQAIVKLNVATRDDAVFFSARQFVNECLAGKINNFIFEDLPSFIRTYARLKESLIKNVKGIPEESLSDVVDALPLAGKEMCLTLLAGEADCFTTLAAHELGDLIMHKDNFVEQALEQAYADRVAESVIYLDKGFALELENADP